MLGRLLYRATHGRLEQSEMHLHGIGYGRARQQLSGSIAQGINEHESIQQPLSRLEVFFSQSRHSGKATISRGSRMMMCCVRYLISSALSLDDGNQAFL
jgi:hypothetical protein